MDRISTESGIPVGNVYDKYGTRNPIARSLVQGFLSAVLDLCRETEAASVHEIGCGEGHLLTRIAAAGFTDVRGSDFSARMIAGARRDYEADGLRFSQKSIYDLAAEDAADLIVCCEVLEHLEHPDLALQRLRSITGKYCVLSVPREPLWRLLNVLRGKYWADLGNTPGHIQHWSQAAFCKQIARYFDVVAIRSPLPWTVALCRPTNT